MARGDLVYTNEVSSLGRGNKKIVGFKVTSDMAPRSRLVVYAVQKNKSEILVDALDFLVDGFYSNKVRTHTYSKQNVTLTLRFIRFR